ncbi:protein SABRE-like isoform X2 [Typha angustifolia]|uniref:protein SABRE-like isoform X2 n=1 Tax=Typha angustifolia TaxID=59011 RepID=UPI003C30216F
MMAFSPVKFMFWFLVACVVGWVVFVFAARLLAWLLSRTLGATVGFRVVRCNCLRDITMTFRKGIVQSISIGEVKLSLRKSLLKLGTSFTSQNPKLELLISDLEIVLRPSAQNVKKTRSQARRSHSRGKGKWMVLSNMARLLSVTVMELIVKVPKASIEVKDLKIDMSKSGGSNPIINVKIHLIPFLVRMCDSQLSSGQSSSFNQVDWLVTAQTCSASEGYESAPFICGDLLVACEFGHHREQRVNIKNLDVTCGDFVVNLKDNMFTTKKPAAVSTADGIEDRLDIKPTEKSKGNKFSILSVKKHIAMLPEKVSFNMPKLDLKFLHQGQDLSICNNIRGICLGSTISQTSEDSGESTSHLNLKMDFSEIHLISDGASSVLEILKVAVVASVDIPMLPPLPIRAEIDVRLGGTQCNLIVSRLKPLLFLRSTKKKPLVLRESSQQETVPTEPMKSMMWTCTISAPELTVMFYSVNDLPLYHGFSQSSHLFISNIVNKRMKAHAELGELNLHMADEYQRSLKEGLLGIQNNLESLLNISRVSLDLGERDTELHDGQDRILSIDIAGMGICFGFQHLESLLSTILSFKTLLKSLSPSTKQAAHIKIGHNPRKSEKGAQILKLGLEKCSVKYLGDVSLENMTVADPKRVNYGSQGGQVLIGVSSDGTPRRASIQSAGPSDCKHLKFYTCLEVLCLRASLEKEKNSMQIELESARSIYGEYPQENNSKVELTLFDLQNAKFVRRAGGLNEIAACSLFNVTDLSVRWEPDPHLALFEEITRIRAALHKIKLQNSDSVVKEETISVDTRMGKLANMDHTQHEKPHKKKESVFAIDVEMLKVSAELADGVETMVQVQSIFSENARIGVLLEGLMLSFNGARIIKSSRMQISRIPVSISNNLLDPKVQTMTTWDWVIQGRDIHICMPYRLQLRAIDDAVEDMLRGMRLIAAAKMNAIFPDKNTSSKRVKTRSTKFRSVRFIIRKITAYIEEEPMQGWLDEHYHLMKTEICESAVRSKLLDESVSVGKAFSGSAKLNLQESEKKTNFNEVEVDDSDILSVQHLQEEIYKRTFQSYYQACQKMMLSEGSGACTSGFQSGFKTSTNRSSLLSLCLTEVDVTLSKIDGGDEGMIEFIKRTDPFCANNEIPFSRMYGSNIALTAGSLTIRLRDYTFPLFSATSGKCQGHIVLAQQATCFQPQILQDVFIGKWWRVSMLRSASGTTPPMKMYSDLPIHFHKGEVSFGVGYEPAFADISYAFTVALRRANLGNRSCLLTTNDQNVLNISQSVATNLSENQPPKRERSLPWWDDMRNYIHGRHSLYFTETRWNLLGTTDPYEKLDRIQISSSCMEIQQKDGCISLSTKELGAYLSSIDSLVKNCSLKPTHHTSVPFLNSPAFSLETIMEWQCESGNPMDHYLYALPVEGEPRKKVYDPFRSTSLSLKWNFSLKPSLSPTDQSVSSTGRPMESSEKKDAVLVDSPTINMGAHDIAWLFKWWNLIYLPPHKLRTFSRWPRFGVPRIARSGNLSLDKVMTENFLRFDATPICINHMPLRDDDPAKGMTFRMTKLKYEMCFSRGKQQYTFDCKREPLDLVYQGLDLHLLKAYLNKNYEASTIQDIQTTNRILRTARTEDLGREKCNYIGSCTDKNRDDGFLLYSDYFTIRRQAPKADSTRLLAWQEAGRKNPEITYMRSEFCYGNESDHTQSDLSDDDGFNVVVADNCQRVFVYGLKLLWNLENRDAVWSWVGGISKAFEPPKPSPSCQYAQRNLTEKETSNDTSEMPSDEVLKPSPGISHSANPPSPKYVENVESLQSDTLSMLDLSSSNAAVKHGNNGESEEEGIRHFMVNIIQPQFNLHSEEANGRFLLAAASGRVLARSFHSVLHVGYEMIEKALGASNIVIPDTKPEMTWKRVELSVMLEHVQAHVAPTDVDPGAGLQWLPKILRSSPKVKRTGALLERVFMPCQMYFRYTRHKGGTPELKVKPLKELAFNSPNITATMTSRQFQVMLDILTNLLFARLPRPRRSSLSCPLDDDDEDENIGEEADEVVPEGTEEVELAKINLERKERERTLLINDIRTLSVIADISGDLISSPQHDDNLWMITGARSTLVQSLKKELENMHKIRKEASSSLRLAMQKAAHLRLMEKEKNKSPSYAMRISMRINKIVWSMLTDGKSFAEAEINDMIYDFDRDYKDIGIAQLTTKSFVVKNCLPNAKSDMLLSAWNPPPEWGKNVMLRVNAKQGAPKDGNSSLDSFQVEIYPLKIYLTEAMYRMMWDYFFPEEEQHLQKRQEIWKVSTTSGSRRVKKNVSVPESSTKSLRELDAPGKVSAPTATSLNSDTSSRGDSSHVSKSQNLRGNISCGSKPELRRTSSFDRTWEETVAESVANELVSEIQSCSISSRKSCPLNSTPESQDTLIEETSRNKYKDPKQVRSGRSPHEEKKTGKTQDEKRARPRKMMEFHNIKISQVELLVTYEGSRIPITDLRLLMDTFHRDDFTGTWTRLFARVKKHIIWGVLKSVTGIQGKKFKDKSHSQRENHANVVPESDLTLSDSDGGQPGNYDQLPVSWIKRPNDGAGDGFVTSIRGLFNSQRKKATAFVLRTMRGEAPDDFHEWSESDIEFSPFARQLTITKAKKLIRRHTKKFQSKVQNNADTLQEQELHPSYESDSDASPHEESNE